MFPESQVLYEALHISLLTMLNAQLKPKLQIGISILTQVCHCPKPEPFREHRAFLEGLASGIRGRHLPQWLRQYGVSYYSGKHTLSLSTEGTLILLKRIQAES